MSAESMARNICIRLRVVRSQANQANQADDASQANQASQAVAKADPRYPTVMIKFNRQIVYKSGLLHKFQNINDYIKQLDLAYTAFKTLYLANAYTTHKVSEDVKNLFINLIILLYHGLYHIKIASNRTFTVKERNYVPSGWKAGDLLIGPQLIAITDQSMHIIKTKFMHGYGIISLASLMQCFASQSIIKTNARIEARFATLDNQPDMSDEELIKIMGGDQDA